MFEKTGFFALPLVLFFVYAVYFYFSHQETVPLTGRSQLVDMSRADEMTLGAKAYSDILHKEKVIPSGKLVDNIRTIGKRLAVVADDPGFEWEFNVINSPQANAFALPGGKVAVYTGIIPIAENANGLAIIMGHEIAHAIARHGAERMAYQKLKNLGMLAVSTSLGDMDVGKRQMIMGALGVGAQYGVMLPFSREHESEADYMGLIYAAKACFDPREAPKLWERMAQASGGKSPTEFMSTHPSHDTRIQQFTQWMPEALKIREQYCGNKSKQ
ncbi:M48 family metallopeptidase [Beggiatoa leptomitoformis]|uniref:M48 family metalloprotease n=1 Tax=Beggiatoa leptomitoformis TaxID=288004 RepID=A0A2N9YC10_9GAMM|nr:M48 family metallopeptidase [Beggiatoa leptomitoformis]ALG66688.1 M48 family metalloprotease [Beggiatoa leptomitoformis]AUI67986.1 M48 family metalloprotease [Beggiatoa leptomitoformis]